LISCTVSKEQYIQILIDKKIITLKPKQESPQSKTPANPS